jgi:conjugal transfer/entry exclusion protein
VNLRVAGQIEAIDELLTRIERRWRAAHQRFERLTRRRAAMSPNDRRASRELLRSEAMGIIGELKALHASAQLAGRLVEQQASPADRGAVDELRTGGRVDTAGRE